MLLSQKLTLAYAAVVSVGGLIGFLKRGSKMSLGSGAVSGLVLYYIYTELPSNPVYAASIGMFVSSTLLIIMGARFRKSGKLFPAGIVAFISFIMMAGYLHGILHKLHA